MAEPKSSNAQKSDAEHTPPELPSGAKAGSSDKALAVSGRSMSLDEAGDILMKKLNTKNPTPKDVSELREALRLLPGVARLVGDLAHQARSSIVDSMSSNAVIKECFTGTLDKIQEELGYEGAPPLERLLIEQIGICYLSMYDAQMRYTSARAQGSMSIDQAAWLERRLTMVQARYLRSIETLARVRKLAKPSINQTVMLNVAKQQINAALGA